MKNLVEMVLEKIEVENDLEKSMKDILEDNLDGYETLEEIKNYIENEAICSSGAVSGLIYYSETKAIFKENFEEILELINEYKEEVGEFNIDFNYNNLVWFSFEYLVNKWNNDIDWEELEEELEEEEEEV